MVVYAVEHSIDDISRYFGTHPKLTTKVSKKSELRETFSFDFYKDPEQLASEYFWEAYFLAEQRPLEFLK